MCNSILASLLLQMHWALLLQIVLQCFTARRYCCILYKNCTSSNGVLLSHLGWCVLLTSLLDKVQKCIVNLIGDEFGSSLQSHSHRRSVATLSLFSI